MNATVSLESLRNDVSYMTDARRGRAELDDDSIIVYLPDGAEDESECDWLARLDAEADSMDAAVARLGLTRDGGGNCGISGQFLVYRLR
jgi:hypothetical protein